MDLPVIKQAAAVIMVVLWLLSGCASKQELIAVTTTDYDYLTGISVVINSAQLENGLRADIIISNPHGVDLRVFQTFLKEEEQ